MNVKCSNSGRMFFTVTLLFDRAAKYFKYARVCDLSSHGAWRNSCSSETHSIIQTLTSVVFSECELSYGVKDFRLRTEMEKRQAQGQGHWKTS